MCLPSCFWAAQAFFLGFQPSLLVYNPSSRRSQPIDARDAWDGRRLLVYSRMPKQEPCCEHICCLTSPSLIRGLCPFSTLRLLHLTLLGAVQVLALNVVVVGASLCRRLLGWLVIAGASTREPITEPVQRAAAPRLPARIPVRAASPVARGRASLAHPSALFFRGRNGRAGRR